MAACFANFDSCIINKKSPGQGGDWGREGSAVANELNKQRLSKTELIVSHLSLSSVSLSLYLQVSTPSICFML